MPDLWTIKGEAGKTLDATVRTLEAARASGLQVAFRGLASDEMTWQIWLADPSEISSYVPDAGQRVSLFLNGDRYFTGHVTGRKPSFSAAQWGYSITVSGPWYWLAKTPLSSEIPDETTVVQERSIYLFRTGLLTAHLASLAARAISLGMPLSLGSLATTATVPRLSLREMSLAEAFSELMRLCVDGMIYFDHSGPDGTQPQLIMQRRNLATAVQITPALVCTPTLSLEPRYDLQISALKLIYATRQTYGSTRASAYQSTSAGVSAGGLPDRQLITVSGPEPGLGLPQDLTDSVTVRSRAISGNIGDALEIWHDLLKAGEASLDGIEVFSEASSDTAVGITTEWPTDPLLIITDADGTDISLTEWPYYLTQGEIKNWWEKDGIEAIQARVTATVATSVIQDTTDPGPETPKWARVLGATGSNHFVIDGGILKVRYVWTAHVSTVVPLVKTLWSADTLLIRQEDWGWFYPPAGFADYLLETQNWVPWEGQVTIASDETPAHNLVGAVLNIAEWVPECANMRAMISGYTVTPATGEITFTLGPPARHSFRDLVNRFRQSGADNTYWLGTGEGADGGSGGGPPPNSILTEEGTYEIDEDNTTYPTTENA